MEIIHETKMSAVCPNGGHINNYEVKLDVPGFIEVEKILEILEDYKETRIFQEDLTEVLCKQIQSYYEEEKVVFIELRGEHLGVMITTKYNYPDTRYKR